ncbi:hypothetical protein QBC43DRAFT_321989 [Cladorrhinum sp. PSN259]|nr:hypothetical protein QBC43DRAFT_321989 [Cladorrhinum sp. PSN259]
MPTYPPLIPGQKFKAYGQEITWTSSHYTPSQLRPLLFSSDEQADQCIARLESLYPTSSPRDHLSLLLSHHSSDPILSQFWSELTTLPDWVSLPQLHRAQRVFYRYLAPNITGLSFQSLLGGLASPSVSSVLSQTNGFSSNAARRRLLQTFQHLLDVTLSPEALRLPDGPGFLSAVRVRLLHASVRRRLLSKSSSSHEPIPINDLHSLATVLSYSISLTDLSLPRQGIFLSIQEREDWLSLWRYLAYLLGTTHDCLSSIDKARAMLESLVVSELNASDTSRRLAASMLASLANKPPMFASEGFLKAQGRWLNGKELSGELGIVDRQRWTWGVYYDLLVAGQCGIFIMGHMLNKAMGMLGLGDWWDDLAVEGGRKVVRKRLGQMLEDTASITGQGKGKGEYVVDWWSFKSQDDDSRGKGPRGGILSIEQKILVMMIVMLGGIGWVGWIVFRALVWAGESRWW